MKTSKTLIRFEHPTDGKGFWNSEIPGTDEECWIDTHSNYAEIRERHCCDEFPSFWNDYELLDQISGNDLSEEWVLDNYRFAFNKLEDLKWALTPEEIKEFINGMGFKVWMIVTEDYFESSYQSMYNPENVIEKKEITSLFL